MRVAFGEYQLDTKTRTLQCEGRRIPVQSKAFDLLAYLIDRRERSACQRPGLTVFRRGPKSSSDTQTGPVSHRPLLVRTSQHAG